MSNPRFCILLLSLFPAGGGGGGWGGGGGFKARPFSFLLTVRYEIFWSLAFSDFS